MKVAIFTLLAVNVVAQSTYQSLPRCELLTIPVTVSNVLQKNLTAPIDYNTFDGSYAAFPNLTVSGTFNISASLCVPSIATAKRNSTLQILVHGATYNKTYWSGLKIPPQSFNGTTYSWVDYAASQGYSTLAIDRLCNGNSSRPDAANVCQVQTQAAVLHQLVQIARNGSLGSSNAFEKFVYVGHSLGSGLGSYYLNSYAGDMNATILTGFSSFSGAAMGNPFAFSAGVRPARDTFPRYSTLSPTYATISDPNTTRTTFYYGSFNEQVPTLDYEGMGTVGVGEFLSLALSYTPKPNVRIPVLVMNGQNDQPVCATTALDGPLGNPGQCGEGPSSLTARSRVVFPNAASYSYYNVANTGHCINLHYSAPVAFAAAHQFLTSHGL